MWFRSFSCVIPVILIFTITSAQHEGQVRLQGGQRATQGRVEIYHSGKWGTICDDNWDTHSANVICRMLNMFQGPVIARSEAYFGQGSSSMPIWLDDVSCRGTETNIINCKLKPWGLQNCDHGEDAGVDCQPSAIPVVQTRLVNGTNRREGRVEIQYQNTWGTVCDDEWNNLDATVVCKQLGFQTNLVAIPLNNAYFGSGSGPVLLDDVKCTGAEASLAACYHKPWKSTDCMHNEDASVMCLLNTGPQNIQIRLAGGLSRYAGRVELQAYGYWGTVCDDHFDISAANVVCKQLGYSRGGTLLPKGTYNGGNGPIWLDDVRCNGTERSIMDCGHKGLGNNDCAHGEDVAISCRTANAPTVSVRLKGGKDYTQGRVEVLYQNVWGTVCDDFWSASDAAVVCRMLHLSFGGAAPISKGGFQAGTGKIWMDDVKCLGTESNIGSCIANNWGTNNCQHDEDAGVICQPASAKFPLRLVGGSSQYSGRVEIQYNGTWGTICDDNFNAKAAAVVCRQLGYSTTGAIARGHAVFGQGTGPIILDDIVCLGTEDSLAKCGHRGFYQNNCDHSEDASVICGNTAASNRTRIRLIGGTTSEDGRVEVLYNNQWGTVCDDYFDSKAAKVVCKMLGFNSSGAQPKLRAYYGQGSGQILLDNVRCQGTESDINQCSHSPWGHSNCHHSEDVGVICQQAPNIRVRLVNGSSTTSGRVEIFYNHTWGTVCDDSFGAAEAGVICHMLGFPRANSHVAPIGTFGRGAGPILLDDLGCDGTENNIVQCSSKGWYENNCEHSEDVGVICNAGSNSSMQIRLVNGPNLFSGRLEVQISGRWGTVCDDSFNANDAKVACKSLRLPYLHAIPVNVAAYGRGTGTIWLDDVHCSGRENSLMTCRHNPVGQSDCVHSEDVGVMCLGTAVPPIVSARLVNGPNSHSGRLEVLYAGKWGTVCDDNFNSKAAMVVCRSLGISNVVRARAVGNAAFGQGSGPIWFDDTVCAGTETNLGMCRHTGFGVSDCDHTEDVGVYCDTATTLSTSVRLVNGSSTHSGLVEVQHNGAWGTICDDGWGINEATVVCKQLGYPSVSAIPLSNSYFGAGQGHIWLDDMNCFGNETNLGQCRHKSFGDNDCGHDEDAGVMCLGTPTNNSITGIRLTAGLSRLQGRVEIKYRGVWGTVCDDSWNNHDATVVCRMLGLTGGHAISNFGGGHGPIWMDDVECHGPEPSLANCTFKGFGEHDCDHTEDAAVTCHDPNLPPLQARLVGGSSHQEGRVEIQYQGQWGTVCDDYFEVPDARVVCRMLGYSTDHPRVFAKAHYGQGSGQIWLDNLRCIGTESSVALCPSNGFGHNNCQHSEDVGIQCNIAGHVITQVHLRLRGGQSPNEGRVEIQYNNTWGTICDDYWDNNAAAVVCRMLNMPGPAVGRKNAFYGRGQGQIWLDDVHCKGNESSITLCAKRDWAQNNCGHDEDAGVLCGSPTTNAPVRLVNGTTSNEGRVEVFHAGAWGSVCDDGFHTNDAKVICRIVGHPTNSPIVRPRAFYGSSRGPIQIDDLKCSGDEHVIDACYFQPWGHSNCDHGEDVGVICGSSSTKTQIRLVGSTTPSQGRVEIRINGTWGTICDDLFDSTDAGVICGMLGYSRTHAIAKSHAYFGRGSGRIWLDDMRCTGQENDILQCSTRHIGQSNCGHSEDAGVICAVQTVQVRLTGGLATHEGRVEIYHNGTWGTICDDYFSFNAAKVVCRMLGFPYAGAYSRRNAPYGRGTGLIQLDNVRCMGTESSIALCRHNPWTVNNCGHDEDVGVVCTNSLSTLTPQITSPTPTIPNPANVFLRLVSGSTGYNGRVEVYNNGVFGTICDDNWTGADANVVCGMLGFARSGATALTQAGFGQGTGKIWLDEVTCSGQEPNIVQCQSNPWGTNDCGHDEDAGVTCSLKRTPDNFLLVTDSTYRLIYRMDLTTYSYIHIPISGHVNPIAIDYDPTEGNIYWTDVGSHQVRSVNINGGNGKTVMQLSNTAVPDGIAVDSVSKLLFYTDTGNNVIVVMTMDGSTHKVIVNSGLDQPRSIICDTKNGVIYWTDWGNPPKIERANYDGTNRKVLVHTGIYWPNGLAADFANQKIYWCDGKNGTFEVIHTDGSNRQLLGQHTRTHLYGLAFINNYLYYTDWTARTIMRINSDGSHQTVIGPPAFGKLNDIHIYKRSATFQGPTLCSNGNGGCSHMCLPRSDGSRVCICPDGLTLQPGGTVCGVAVPCNSLTAPANGQLTPANCTTSKQTSGMSCQVSCKSGYQLLSPSKIICMINGQWSNYGSPLICKDTQAPKITCPADISQTAPKGSQTVTVTWTQPTATDNSGQKATLIQTLQSPVTLGEGVQTVTVTAFDSAGLSSACNFKITVKVLRCPTLTPPGGSFTQGDCSNNHYGANCRLQCKNGFKPSKDGMVSCAVDADQKPYWTLSGFSCTAIFCANPQVPVGGAISGKGCTAPYTYGTVCTQSCSGQQTLMGPVTRICGSDGTWSGSVMICTSANYLRSSNSPSNDHTTAIVVGVVVGVILLALIVTGAFLFYRRMQFQLSGGSGKGAYELETTSFSGNRNTNSSKGSTSGLENPMYNFGSSDS